MKTIVLPSPISYVCGSTSPYPFFSFSPLIKQTLGLKVTTVDIEIKGCGLVEFHTQFLTSIDIGHSWYLKETEPKNTKSNMFYIIMIYE